MPPNQSNANLERWILNHGLPWNDTIEKFFFKQGVNVVEDIKVIKRSLFLEQFEHEKPVVQTKAKLAWKELGGEDTFQFGEAATTIHLDKPPSPPTAAARAASGVVTANMYCRDSNLKSVMHKGLGFTTPLVMFKEEKKAKREERIRKKLAIERFGVIDVDLSEDDKDVDEEEDEAPEKQPGSAPAPAGSAASFV